MTGRKLRHTATSKDTNERTLLETKLRPPTALRSEVQRGFLTTASQSELERSVCVVASAGSGKTTFLRQLHQQLGQSGKHCAWLNLDERDNDPVSLIPYLFSAIRKLSQGGVALVQPPLTAQDTIGMAEAFQVLEYAITALPPNGVLFLDDFHYITNPALLGNMNHFLDACGEHLQIAIGTRTLPELQIPRRILSGQFETFPGDRLKFTFSEAETFFQSQTMLNLSHSDVAAATKATEGWAAGLQFTAITLRSKSADAPFVMSFPNANEHHIADYLATNVLGEQSDELRDFLLKTAPLRRFNAPLCRHVSGFVNAEDLLH